MASASELSLFSTETAFAIPTMNYAVGISDSSGSLKDYKTLPSSGANVTYDKATHTVKVTGNNVVLDHYDFSGANVVVSANNVKITNSKFDASVGAYTVRQMDGYNGLVIDHNTFDGGKIDRPLSDFVFGGTGKITVTNNAFMNAPSDAVHISNGVVDHNYFSGTGYMTGAHADAIQIDGTTGPITITNNFVDSRMAADAKTGATSAIAIGNYYGNTTNITVEKNILLGGAYTVYVQDFGANTMKNMVVTDNYVGAGLFGDLYPNRQPADLVYNKSAAPNLVETTSVKPSAGLIVVGKVGVVGEVLQGGAGSDHLYGHGDSNVLIGGGGRDFLFGGKGADIFTYKATADSTVGQPDVVGGFEVGIDKIDLHFLATNDKPLTFIGEAAFNGTAGAVHAVHSGASTFVEVDLNGDKVADMKIELQGSLSLTSKDFTLASAQALVPAPAVELKAPVTTDSNVSTSAKAVSMVVTGKSGLVGELLKGGDASDHVFGHGNGDFIVGGGERDFLFGGKGTDVFVFNAVGDSTAARPDVIGGFEVGIDKIDLHSLATHGNPLTFIGTAAFDGMAGEVHAIVSGTSTFAEIDLNGDKVADMRIEFQSLKGLSAHDFLL